MKTKSEFKAARAEINLVKSVPTKFALTGRVMLTPAMIKQARWTFR